MLIHQLELQLPGCTLSLSIRSFFQLYWQQLHTVFTGLFPQKFNSKVTSPYQVLCYGYHFANMPSLAQSQSS